MRLLSDRDWVAPAWRDEPFDRDRATADRWDRLDDEDARGRDRVDVLTRDMGEAGYGKRRERREVA